MIKGITATEPGAIAAFLHRRAPDAERIGLETGPLSVWLWNELLALGLPMICMDARHANAGLKVMLAAADTFRAAAIDQLKVWGERVGAEVVAKAVGADPAGIAFEAFERARAGEADVLLIDTAGRLQNKSDLMAELAKIVRVLKKIDESAPHGVILVLDATTGQNALAQVEIFKQIAGVTGIVVTKLDGTARGGILVAIAERFKLPINAIGIGEGLDDLKPFDAQDFARAIAGANRAN